MIPHMQYCKSVQKLVSWMFEYTVTIHWMDYCTGILD